MVDDDVDDNDDVVVVVVAIFVVVESRITGNMITGKIVLNNTYRCH